MKPENSFQNPVDYFDIIYEDFKKQAEAQAIHKPRVSAFIDVGALFKGQLKRVVACGMLYYAHKNERERIYIAFWEDLDAETTAIFLYHHAELFRGLREYNAENGVPNHPHHEVVQHCRRTTQFVSPRQLQNGKHESFKQATPEKSVDELKGKLFTWFDQPRTFGSDVPRDDDSW
ncbi:unnamed protein product, partial [Amoebophrya sp. A120]|eukprot:GSA120T00014689001.1